jgi:exodeoxyribonuclease VII large subunit
MIDDGLRVAARPVRGVVALLAEVGDLLAQRFVACAVRGEISGYMRAASGHCYFNLKDADGGSAVLRCVMFRRAASLLGFAPVEGQLVELRGRLGVYEPRGELQFVVEAMQAAGAGALYERFLRTKARLEALGLFDPARKRAVPAYPRAVGIITSPDAAALHDVLAALARRAPHVRVVVYPSPVQGPEAPERLAQAIDVASRRGEVDALVVCRGGGSMEDLWAFNDERVVRAIVAATRPVVCGVGHETDVTLADFAADLRAPTPTAAAELVAPRREACLEQLDARAARLRRRVRGALDLQAQRLDRLGTRLARPEQSVRERARQLALYGHRLAGLRERVWQAQRVRLAQTDAELRHSLQRRVATMGQRLDRLEARLHALDPSRVLARGYAWLTDAEGRAVTTVKGLAVGDEVKAVLHDGTADVTVAALHAGTRG